MKATSITPAIISIETPVDQSLPPSRKEELLRLIEKHRPAQLVRRDQQHHQ